MWAERKHIRDENIQNIFTCFVNSIYFSNDCHTEKCIRNWVSHFIYQLDANTHPFARIFVQISLKIVKRRLGVEKKRCYCAELKYRRRRSSIRGAINSMKNILSYIVAVVNCMCYLSYYGFSAFQIEPKTLI